MCYDARELVIGCAIHVCSPSGWKYHSRGKAHICRHHFYHVVTLVDENYQEVRRRRRGKPLRGCLAIIRDTNFGMVGRIVTFQDHPFECSTNYAALVAMRCNVDVQDLRRVVDHTLWMRAEDWEPDSKNENGEVVRDTSHWSHGAGETNRLRAERKLGVL